MAERQAVPLNACYVRPATRDGRVWIAFLQAPHRHRVATTFMPRPDLDQRSAPATVFDTAAFADAAAAAVQQHSELVSPRPLPFDAIADFAVAGRARWRPRLPFARRPAHGAACGVCPVPSAGRCKSTPAPSNAHQPSAGITTTPRKGRRS